MKYNFDEIIPRRGSGCLKWDSGNPDALPMWVADMDFRVAQPILDGLMARTQHGIFGYSVPMQSYYDAITGWFSRRHGWTIQPEWISHCPGIVPALHFFVEVAYNELIYRDGRYEIDFEKFEQIAKDPQVKMFYLCSPHNPGGRIWTREELERMGRICTENGVLVVADEIHCDLVMPGHEHTSYGTLPEEIVDNSIICVAPSKTFNLAGLQTSCLVIKNPQIKKAYDTFLDSLGIMRPSAYGIAGLVAAYSQGDEWLDQLLDYLKGNLDFLREYLAKNIPQIKIMEPDATYLVWMDFKALHVDSREFHELLLKEGHVWLDEGYVFGKVGEGFERINIACPRATLEDGLNRMRDALRNAGLI